MLICKTWMGNVLDNKNRKYQTVFAHAFAASRLQGTSLSNSDLVCNALIVPLLLDWLKNVCFYLFFPRYNNIVHMGVSILSLHLLTLVNGSTFLLVSCFQTKWWSINLPWKHIYLEIKLWTIHLIRYRFYNIFIDKRVWITFRDYDVDTSQR